MYSFKKGLVKGLTGFVITGLGISLALFPEFMSIGIADLVAEYAKMVFGSMTMGGLLTFGVNWLKNRN